MSNKRSLEIVVTKTELLCSLLADAGGRGRGTTCRRTRTLV